MPADSDLRNRRQGRLAGDPAPELPGVSGRRLPDLRQNVEESHVGRPSGLLLRDRGACQVPAQPQGY